jgi:hypothetical protein
VGWWVVGFVRSFVRSFVCSARGVVWRGGVVVRGLGLELGIGFVVDQLIELLFKQAIGGAGERLVTRYQG